MDAATWWCGRGADKEPFGRHAIGYDACCRPGEELAQVLHAAIDIAADVVRVVSLDLRRPHHTACDDAFTEAGRKTSICASIRAVMSTVEPFGTWQ